MEVLFNKLLSDELFFFQTVILGFFFIVMLINIFQVRKLRKALNKVTHNQDGMSIEEAIDKYYDDIDKTKATYNEILERINAISEILKHCTSRVGIVRFNAFSEVGGNQSFAIALLDSEDTGIVISSLYGRESSHFYGKPVIKGKSTYPLSKEEEEAVTRAKARKLNDE